MCIRDSYKRARDGEDVKPKSRVVEVFSLELELMSDTELHYKMEVSKGTYVRSIARDIGEVLGCGACVKTLSRSKSEPFELGQAVALEELLEKNDLSGHLMPIDLFKQDKPAAFSIEI